MAAGAASLASLAAAALAGAAAGRRRKLLPLADLDGGLPPDANHTT